MASLQSQATTAMHTPGLDAHVPCTTAVQLQSACLSCIEARWAHALKMLECRLWPIQILMNFEEALEGLVAFHHLQMDPLFGVRLFDMEDQILAG